MAATPRREKLVNQDRPAPASSIIDAPALLAEQVSSSPPIVVKRSGSTSFPALSSVASGLMTLSSSFSLSRSHSDVRSSSKSSPGQLLEPARVDKLGRLSFPSDNDDDDDDFDDEDDDELEISSSYPARSIKIPSTSLLSSSIQDHLVLSTSSSIISTSSTSSSTNSTSSTSSSSSSSSSSSTNSSSSTSLMDSSSQLADSLKKNSLSSSDSSSDDNEEDSGPTLAGDTPELQTLRVLRFVETPVAEEYIRSVATRPAHLTPKSAEEEARHRREYLDMLRQQKEKLERAAVEQRLREEELAQVRSEWKRIHSSAAGASLWSAEVLRSSATVQRLIWHGVPANWRPLVWDVLIGNPLHITEEQFNECALVSHMREVKGMSGSDTRRQILIDLPRTFPSLKIFTADGPLNGDLLEILEAFRIVRPDIGYVQGMSYVGGMLLMNMEKFLAFRCLTHILARPFFVALYRMDMPALDRCFTALEMIVNNRLPQLAAHFRHIDLQYQSFALDWFTTIFARSLPFDTAALIWDLYMYYSTPVLFRTAYAILYLLRRSLLSRELDGCYRILSRLHVKWDAKELLHEIASVVLSDAETALIRSIGS